MVSKVKVIATVIALIFAISVTNASIIDDASFGAKVSAQAGDIVDSTSFGGKVEVAGYNWSDPSGIWILNITAEAAAESAPSIDNITNLTPTKSTTVITWDTNQSDSDNRVEYGTNSGLTGASWSSWDNNTDDINITLSGLSSNTKYYYQGWSYNGTNSSYKTNSSIKNFTTTKGEKYYDIIKEASIAWRSFYHNLPRYKFNPDDLDNVTTIKLPTSFTTEYFGWFYEHTVTVSSIEAWGWDGSDFTKLSITEVNSSGYWNITTEDLTDYESIIVIPNPGWFDDLRGLYGFGGWLHRNDVTVAMTLGVIKEDKI